MKTAFRMLSMISTGITLGAYGSAFLVAAILPLTINLY